MSLDYAREKYWDAVDVLVGASPIQRRLTFAAELLLRLRPDEDIPDPELKVRHDAVLKKLTATPLSDERDYQPRKLSDDEAADLSREILSIYIGLRGGI
jgi:hypothetical protein